MWAPFFVLLCINPWTELSASESPFVKTFGLIGIPVAAGLINFVVLTSAASACNSGMFSTSRILYNLSHQKQGPSSFGRLNKHAVPSNALFVSTIVVSVGALFKQTDSGTSLWYCHNHQCHLFHLGMEYYFNLPFEI